MSAFSAVSQGGAAEEGDYKCHRCGKWIRDPEVLIHHLGKAHGSYSPLSDPRAKEDIEWFNNFAAYLSDLGDIVRPGRVPDHQDVVHEVAPLQPQAAAMASGDLDIISTAVWTQSPAAARRTPSPSPGATKKSRVSGTTDDSDGEGEERTPSAGARKAGAQKNKQKLRSTQLEAKRKRKAQSTAEVSSESSMPTPGHPRRQSIPAQPLRKLMQPARSDAVRTLKEGNENEDPNESLSSPSALVGRLQLSN